MPTPTPPTDRSTGLGCGTEQPGGPRTSLRRGWRRAQPGARCSLSKGVLLPLPSEKSWSCQANRYFSCGEKVNTNLLLLFQFVEQPMFPIWKIQNLWRDKHCGTLVTEWRPSLQFYVPRHLPNHCLFQIFPRLPGAGCAVTHSPTAGFLIFPLFES